MSYRNPKNKYSYQLTYGKAIKEIGSSSSFTANEIDEIHPMIKHHADQAKRNNTILTVVIKENKNTFPEFDWQEVKKYTL